MTANLRMAIDLLAVLVVLPALIASAYLLVLTVLSFRALPALRPEEGTRRFDVIVPAHNEAQGIADTVRSLLSIDYPSTQRQIIVIADNCTDETAARAREAGAIVRERHDLERRGKGYALSAAFEGSVQEGFAEAVVVIDADSVVDPNMLRAFAARLNRGAQAIQAHYGVRNPDASWRTRLMTIALAAFHQVRSLGRDHLRVSCGLRGNGMCLSTVLLKQLPYDAFSIVEDLEYGIRLGRAGRRVEYAPETYVLGEMVSNEAGSRSQRTRWEHGRAQMRHIYGWPLLKDAVARGNRLLFDLAFDVLIPPLGQLVSAMLGGLAITAFAWGSFGLGLAALMVLAISLGFVCAHVMGGWWHSKTGVQGLKDLTFAPAYIAWKLLLARRQHVPASLEWVRTSREQRRLP